MNQEEIKNRIYELSEEYDNGNCSEQIETELKDLLTPYKMGQSG